MSALSSEWAVSALLAARQVADYAKREGALLERPASRPTCEHMGAIVADSVLQAGLNYSNVVRPRVASILRSYPQHNCVSVLLNVVRSGQTSKFLRWDHPTKIGRFDGLVLFLHRSGIETASDLRGRLADAPFRHALEAEVDGVGPKTVDYMACLVGVDSIAVDRHVRTFARRAGVDDNDYQFLHQVFCSAADLLSVSRRDFDSWVWMRESSATGTQLAWKF
jgi:hypothetical protein